MLDENPGPLEAEVSRNDFGAAEPTLGARWLAAYMRHVAARLAEQNADALTAAKFEFPDPASVDGSLKI